MTDVQFLSVSRATRTSLGEDLCSVLSLAVLTLHVGFMQWHLELMEICMSTLV